MHMGARYQQDAYDRETRRNGRRGGGGGGGGRGGGGGGGGFSENSSIDDDEQHPGYAREVRRQAPRLPRMPPPPPTPRYGGPYGGGGGGEDEDMRMPMPQQQQPMMRGGGGRGRQLQTMSQDDHNARMQALAQKKRMHDRMAAGDHMRNSNLQMRLLEQQRVAADEDLGMDGGAALEGGIEDSAMLGMGNGSNNNNHLSGGRGGGGGGGALIDDQGLAPLNGGGSAADSVVSRQQVERMTRLISRQIKQDEDMKTLQNELRSVQAELTKVVAASGGVGGGGAASAAKITEMDAALHGAVGRLQVLETRGEYVVGTVQRSTPCYKFENGLPTLDNAKPPEVELAAGEVVRVVYKYYGGPRVAAMLAAVAPPASAAAGVGAAGASSASAPPHSGPFVVAPTIVPSASSDKRVFSRIDRESGIWAEIVHAHNVSAEPRHYYAMIFDQSDGTNYIANYGAAVPARPDDDTTAAAAVGSS